MATQRSLLFEPVKPARRRRAFHARALNISPERYAEESKAAATQEARVLQLFEANPDALMTPYDVAAALDLCLNSARRACSDLAFAGLLRKDQEPVKAGRWGKRSHRWQLARKESA